LTWFHWLIGAIFVVVFIRFIVVDIPKIVRLFNIKSGKDFYYVLSFVILFFVLSGLWVWVFNPLGDMSYFFVAAFIIATGYLILQHLERKNY